MRLFVIFLFALACFGEVKEYRIDCEKLSKDNSVLGKLLWLFSNKSSVRCGGVFVALDTKDVVKNNMFKSLFYDGAVSSNEMMILLHQNDGICSTRTYFLRLDKNSIQGCQMKSSKKAEMVKTNVSKLGKEKIHSRIVFFKK